MSTSLTKRAFGQQPAEPGSEAEFEQTLSQLAAMDVRDRAMTLVDYGVGFQLLGRDKKKNTAEGVAVFKINEQWLLVPVVYTKGAIKGTNCLYLMEDDQILPNTEAQVQALINKPGRPMGKSVLPQPTDHLTPSPDLRALSEPRASNKLGRLLGGRPLTGRRKEASLALVRLPQHVAKSAHQLLASVAEGPPGPVAVRLKKAVLELGKTAVQVIADLARRRPELLAGFAERHGGLDTLKQAALTEPPAPKKASGRSVLGLVKSAKSESQVIVRSFSSSRLLPATGDPFEYASPRGAVVQDGRPDDETSKIVEMSIQQKGFGTPTVSGIYDVVMTGGTLERCLVLVAPEGETQRRDMATVVRLEKPNWANVAKQAILGQAVSDGTGGPSPLDFLSDATIKVPGQGDWYDSDYYVVVAPDGRGTAPFRVRADSSQPEEKSGTVYHVDFSDHRDYGSTPAWAKQGCGYGESVKYVGDDGEQRIKYLRLSGAPGSSMVRVGEELVVPKGSKTVLAYKQRKQEKSYGDGEKYMSSVYREDDSDAPALRPGGMLDVDLAMGAAAPVVKLARAPGGYFLNGQWHTPMGAFAALVKCGHLRGAYADALLDKADQAPERNREVAFRVKAGARGKRADFGSFPPPWPQDPGYGGASPEFGNVPQLMGMEDVTQSPFGGSQQHQQNRLGPNLVEPDPMSVINSAVQTGQQDVVDAGMLGALLQSTNSQGVIDRYLPDIRKGVDRLGRIALHMARLPEAYEERYGRSDAVRLEEETNECFDRLGKLVLQFSDNRIGGDEGDQIVSDLSKL